MPSLIFLYTGFPTNLRSRNEIEHIIIALHMIYLIHVEMYSDFSYSTYIILSCATLHSAILLDWFMLSHFIQLLHPIFSWSPRSLIDSALSIQCFSNVLLYLTDTRVKVSAYSASRYTTRYVSNYECPNYLYKTKMPVPVDSAIFWGNMSLIIIKFRSLCPSMCNG